MLSPQSLRFIQYVFTDLFGLCYFVLPVVLTLAGQLLLCFRAKRVPIKLIPTLLGSGLLLFTLLLYLICGSSLGFLLLFPLGTAGLILLGSASGWLAYAVARACKKLSL